MAFDISALRALGGGGAFWLWHYRTADPLATILAPAISTGTMVSWPTATSSSPPPVAGATENATGRFFS